MYLIYADESGDCGLVNTPSDYFILGSLVIHELRWKQILDELINFRRYLNQQFGFKSREEFHAAKFITHPGSLIRISKWDRLVMIRKYAEKLRSLSDINVFSVIVNKAGKPPNYDVFENAWKTLIQRFENTLFHHNFRGPVNADTDQRGMIIADHTDDKKLRDLLRRMRYYNPITNQPQYGPGYRDKPIQYIIEDPSFRSSDQSYFVQSVDLVAFLLYQFVKPNTYMRKKGAQNYFRILEPILCKVVSRDGDGIVWL